MAFCSNCGKKVVENANFCASCGKTVAGVAAPPPPQPEAKPRTVTAGQVKKCPSCGSPIESFRGCCPDCGYELNATGVAESVQEFAEKFNSNSLKKIMTKIGVDDTDDYIENFPVPNNREDLLEFGILSFSKLNRFILNPTGMDHRTIGKDRLINSITVWITKMEQVRLKAQIVLADDQASLSKITTMYNQINDANEKARAAIGKYIIKRKRAIVIIVVIIVIAVIGIPLVLVFLFLDWVFALF